MRLQLGASQPTTTGCQTEHDLLGFRSVHVQFRPAYAATRSRSRLVRRRAKFRLHFLSLNDEQGRIPVSKLHSVGRAGVSGAAHIECGFFFGARLRPAEMADGREGETDRLRRRDCGARLLRVLVRSLSPRLCGNRGRHSTVLRVQERQPPRGSSACGLDQYREEPTQADGAIHQGNWPGVCVE